MQPFKYLFVCFLFVSVLCSSKFIDNFCLSVLGKVQFYCSCFFSIPVQVLSMQLFNWILHSVENVWCHGYKLISANLGYVVVLHKAGSVIQKYSVIIKYRFQLILQLLYKLLDNEEVFIQLLKCTFRKHYCRRKGGKRLITILRMSQCNCIIIRKESSFLSGLDRWIYRYMSVIFVSDMKNGAITYPFFTYKISKVALKLQIFRLLLARPNKGEALT